MTPLQRFRRLDARLRKLEAEHAEALRTLQKTCKHPNKIECEYKSTPWGTSRPLRVCKDCGLLENLRHRDEYSDQCREDIPMVSREAVLKYARHVGEG